MTVIDHPAAQTRRGRFVNAVGLSEREQAVVSRIARGHSNEDIGRELYLSVNTIKSYIRSAYRRMDVETRTQAVVWAFDHGLVTPMHLVEDVA